MNIILSILLFNIIYSQCNDGYIDINENCYFESDIEVIEQFINNSEGSINLLLDINNNGLIEPLELCTQEWENGRIVLFDCNPIIINGSYNWIDISGDFPNNIANWSYIETMLIPYNNLSGLVPESICELNIDFSDENNFDINSNYLCPPYPECIEDFVFQSNWGSGVCELSDCYDFGVSEVAMVEVDGDDILNPYDDFQGVASLLVNVHNDGPSCSAYPGLMITSDTEGITFPFASSNEGQYINWWYAIFSDYTYFSNIPFEVSPFIPIGTEINFIIETVTMGCYEDSCSEDPNCHDCPLTPSVSISITVGEPFPNMLGDSNLDGVLNVLDIVEVVHYILYPQNEEFYESNLLLFNMINLNEDNFINISDVIILINSILNN